jgi:hypothetical protein
MQFRPLSETARVSVDRLVRCQYELCSVNAREGPEPSQHSRHAPRACSTTLALPLASPSPRGLGRGERAATTTAMRTRACRQAFITKDVPRIHDGSRSPWAAAFGLRCGRRVTASRTITLRREAEALTPLRPLLQAGCGGRRQAVCAAARRPRALDARALPVLGRRRERREAGPAQGRRCELRGAFCPGFARPVARDG